MSTEIAKLHATITADVSGFDKGLASAKQGMGGFGAAAGAAMGLATKAIDIAIGAVEGLAKSTIGAAVDWDKSFKNIQAVTKKSTDGIQKQILGMKSAVAGPMELADAMYDIVGGVADASTHMAILNAANRTAEAGSANLKATTQGLISVMNSYKFSATQAAFASDVLTQTVNKGVGTMDQFVAAISPISGLAASVGVKFDEMGAAMAFMTTKGATAAQAGTELQASMTALLKPNSAMNDLLKKVNVSTGNATAATGKMVTTTKAGAGDLAKYNDELAKTQARLTDLSGKKNKSAMDQYNLNKLTGKAADLQAKVADGSQIVKYAQGAGNAQKVTAEWLIKTYGLVGALNKLKEAAGGSSQKMAEALGSVEALRAFVALTGGDFTEFEKDFKDGLSGATEAARQVQLQSVSAQFETFKHTLEGVAIAIGSVVLPALNGIFTFLNKGAEVVGKFGPIIQDGLTKIGGVFQPLLDEITRITKPISDAFGNIQLAFDKFFEDLFGDTTISAAGQRLSKKLGEVIAPDKTLQEKIGPAFAGLKDAIAEELGKIDFIGIATGLINAAASFGEGLARSILTGILDLGSRLIAQLGAQLSGIDIFAVAANLITSAVKFGMELPGKLIDGLSNLATDIGTKLDGINAVDIGAQAATFLANAVTFAGTIISKIVNGLLGLGQQTGDTVATEAGKVDLDEKASGLLTKAGEVGSKIVGKIIEGLASFATTLGIKFAGEVSKFDPVAAAKTLLDKAGEIGGKIINGIVTGVAGLGDQLIAAIKAELGKVLAGVQDTANSIGTAIAGALMGKQITMGGGGGATETGAGGTGASAGVKAGGGLKRIKSGTEGGAPAGQGELAGQSGAADYITGFETKMEADGYRLGAAIQAALDSVTVDTSGMGAKLASMFSGVDITAALTNLGTTISASIATTFGPDGAVMTALKPFEEAWAQMFGGGGTIAAAAVGMQGTIDGLTASIVNVGASGTPALLGLEAISTSAAPSIASAWGPVVGVFRELLMVLEGIAGAAQRATGAMGAVPGVGGGGVAGARAGGGAVARGKTYLVGENGAELFTASSNGRIIPNGGSASAGGGGGGVTISGTVNVYGVQNVNQLYDELKKVGQRRND